jgi:hypothetical protein
MSFLVKGIIILITLTFSFTAPVFIKAQVITNPLEADTIEELIEDIIDLLFYIGLAITPIMIVIAAYYFLTSAGDPSKVQIAKRIIFWTVVGMLIILLAKGVISVVRQILSV